jgi:hypothetical protein
MATGVASSSDILTLADLLERLGCIPAERVRWRPLPGTATKDDVVESETLKGEPALPGFELPLRDLFAKLDSQA